MRNYPPQHRAIVMVDIAGFTHRSRTELHRLAMHTGLYEIMRTAFDEAGIGWAGCAHEDRGDGLLVLAPADCAAVRLADHLPGRLVAGLLRYNAVHAEPAQLQLRLALHLGEVRITPHGKVGDAINHTARILDADEARGELTWTGGVLAVIASDRFHTEVIKDDPATGPAGYQPIPVNVKQTQGSAWLRILHPARPVAELELGMMRLNGSITDRPGDRPAR